MDNLIRRQGFIPILILLFLPHWVGCAAVVAGGAGAGGTYRYIRGELERSFESDYERAWVGANKACRTLEMQVDGRFKDALSAELEGLMPTGEQFVIRLVPEGKSFVTISVRIGLVGDRKKSQEVLEAIHLAIQESK
jgi:hypothetical protein